MVPVVVVCTVRILIVTKRYATGIKEVKGKRGAPGVFADAVADGDQWGGKGKISVRLCDSP